MLRALVFLLALLLAPLADADEQAQDNPDAKPLVSKADLQIIKRAESILNSPSVWNSHDTRECDPKAKKYSLYCALEKATRDVTAKFDHRGAVMQEARFVIDEIKPKANYEHRLMGFNNDETVHFSDIKRVLHLVHERIESKLK